MKFHFYVTKKSKILLFYKLEIIKALFWVKTHMMDLHYDQYLLIMYENVFSAPKRIKEDVLSFGY